jgi:HAE1 family hydrophobic/amphiphilic exporter-1
VETRSPHELLMPRLIRRVAMRAKPRIVTVASYPAASAQTVDDNVASIIEESLDGADGMLYYGPPAMGWAISRSM